MNEIWAVICWIQCSLNYELAKVDWGIPSFPTEGVVVIWPWLDRAHWLGILLIAQTVWYSRSLSEVVGWKMASNWLVQFFFLFFSFLFFFSIFQRCRRRLYSQESCQIAFNSVNTSLFFYCIRLCFLTFILLKVVYCEKTVFPLLMEGLGENIWLVLI